MANRRMFSLDIVNSDSFLSMPLSAQALYYHFGMRADDDGVLANAKSIMRLIGASDDDFNILLAKRFVIIVSGTYVVVKGWKINNYIQADHYHPSQYTEVTSQLYVEKNKSYTLDKQKGECLSVDTKCIQNGYKMDTEVSIGKSSLGKSSKGEDSKETSRNKERNGLVTDSPGEGGDGHYGLPF